MNSIRLIAVADLLFVMEYSILVTMESNISPINGLLKSGAAK
jgi:hypothetical protein